MATNDEVLTTAPTASELTGTEALDTANRNQMQTATTTGNTTMASGASSTPTLNQDYLNNYMNALGGGVDHSADIDNMYNGLLDKNLAQLEAANKINQSEYEANRQQLVEDYNKQVNQSNIDYERNRYNQNLQAQMNGLNTGTGSQMSLALNNQYQSNQNALRSAQVKAQADLDRALSNLNVQYQADVAAAIGENDYQKAAALYQDKLNREQQIQSYYKMLTDEMNTRASYGDFSMMKEFYGSDAAAIAEKVWATQNPRAAYDQGTITAQQYYNITGEWPRGYTPKSSAGSGGTGNFANSFYARAKSTAAKGNGDIAGAIEAYRAGLVPLDKNGLTGYVADAMRGK